MPWFNVDDGFAFHRKAVRAGNAAVGLWVRAGSWCANELTDGFVPDHMVRTMGTVKQAERLVMAGLWVRDDERGGFQFHEYAEAGRNLTREVVLKKREQAAEKKRRQREGNAQKSGNAQVGESCPEGTDGGVPEGVPGGVNDTSPLPSPPSTTKKTSSSSPHRQEPAREDVDELCRRLLGRVQANGVKASITNDWRTEARLLLDRDQRPLEQALRLVDWATDHPFWKANILSMPKFRKQYSQLLLKARAEQQQQRGQPASVDASRTSTGSKRVDKALGFLSTNDPLRESYGIAPPQSELHALESGKTA